jgi:hypothetical protein
MTASLAAVPDALLERCLELPVDRPMTSREVRDCGFRFSELNQLIAAGLLLRPVRGVYVWKDLEDDLALRVRILKLVVPTDCVVTDRTAGWLWGANMILAPNDHLVVPRVSIFCPPGLRLRNGLVDSGERRFARDDVVDLDGLRVTTALRTACDLGRLLHRDQAFAALDSLAALRRFRLEELEAVVRRYKRYRGVIQLRSFVPLVDPRSQSPGESILRLRWYDTGLPRPECQIEVMTPWSSAYFLDIGLPDIRYAAEYDGEQFHGAEQAQHDESRRAWLREEADWHIDVARKHQVQGQSQDIHAMLRTGYDAAVRAARR